MPEKKELPKSFNRLIVEAGKPVLTDFFATWCNPCKVVSPIISQLAREYKGRILSVKIDIDKNRHVQRKYLIQSVPTVILFWKGKELFRIVGVQAREYYKEQIEMHLPKEQQQS
jgi:thioredoxin 1